MGGSTSKRKNLLPEEQILYFDILPPMRREAKMKMAEFLPLKLYPSTFSQLQDQANF